MKVLVRHFTRSLRTWTIASLHASGRYGRTKFRCDVRAAKSRVAFGKPLSENSNVLNVLGNCRVEVNGARLLTLYAAHVLDQLGIKDSRARSAVAACKISAPNVGVLGYRSVHQLFGGEGVSQDSPLARLYAGARTLRIADGPDEVHLETVAKIDLRRSKL